MLLNILALVPRRLPCASCVRRRCVAGTNLRKVDSNADANSDATTTSVPAGRALELNRASVQGLSGPRRAARRRGLGAKTAVAWLAIVQDQRGQIHELGDGNLNRRSSKIPPNLIGEQAHIQVRSFIRATVK